jgi:hypothetical protein
MGSTVSNRRSRETERPKLDVERVRLYSPETEWTYSHHPSVTFFKGRFYAIWSNGWIDEDAPAQRVLISSADDFSSWSEPAPLIDTLMGKESELVFTAAGFHQYDGTLVAYAGQYEHTPDVVEEYRRLPAKRGHIDTTLRGLTTTDGVAWSDLIDFGLPIVPNHGPQPTSTGRLIISGNISFPYTDDPSGLDGWTMAGFMPKDGQYVDDSAGFRPTCRANGWDFYVCEGSFYETDDHVLHMLFREESLLRVSESRDDGVTWSVPVMTDFTDTRSKFHCGRLPDGCFYNVSCPDPKSGRWPLVISLSQDGVVFDRAFIIADEFYEQKREGACKGGLYGYPHTMIREGMMYVIVSLRKEAVEVIRFPLDQLRRNRS